MIERTVVAAIVRREGRVLLTRRPPGGKHGGLWEFPGGKVETGERPEEALRREVREELGREVEVGRLRDRVRTEGGDGGGGGDGGEGRAPLTILFFECVWPEGEEPLHLGVEEHRWFDPGEAGSLPMPPADAAVLDRLAPRGSKRSGP